MSCHKIKHPLTKRKQFIVMATLLIATVSWAEDSPWLLGDWDGKRRALAEKGFEFEFVLMLEGVQNVAGGVARSSRGLTNLDLIMDAWGKALGLSENGDLHLFLLDNSGGSPSEMIGDIQVSSNIEAPETFKLYEAWWQQRYADDSIA